MTTRLEALILAAIFLGIARMALHIGGFWDLAWLAWLEQRFPLLTDLLFFRSVKRWDITFGQPTPHGLNQLNRIARRPYQVLLGLTAVVFAGGGLYLLVGAIFGTIS